MAALQNSLLLLSIALGLVCASDLFGSDIDDVDYCGDKCNKSYAAHTYEHGTHSECCKRGCRFYAILDFVNDHSDSNSSLVKCKASCDEAYANSAEEKIACNLGCQSQSEAPVSSNTQQPGMEDVSVHMLYPLLYMHGIYSNMIDKVYQHMEVSWSLFMQADNGQLVVIRSRPHITNVIASDIEDFPDHMEWPDDKTSSYIETNIASQDNSATPLLNFRASQMRAARGSDDGLQLDVDSSSDNGRSDWLTCVARKTGIARIILCFLILATAIVMIWFCLTAAATAPEQHLSINGDLEYLRNLDEKESFKLLHPQERVEAQFLPIKIRVERI